MEYSITNQNLVIVHGGHSSPGVVHRVPTRGGGSKVKSTRLGPGKPGGGMQRHYPIFKGRDGQEYVSLNGQSLTAVSSLNLDKHARRETVQRVKP